MKHSLLALSLLGLTCCSEDKPTSPDAPRPVIVQTVTEAQGDEIRTFSGIVKASDSATLGFEVPGRITTILAEAGQSYKKGEVLAQLDVANLESDLRRATAEAQQMNSELQRVQQLFESGNTSRAKLDSAIAAQKAAAANVEIAKKKVSSGTLVMPYDGVIESLLLDEQGVVSAGTGVLTIQGNGKMKILISVPAELINQIKVGMRGTVTVGRIAPDSLPAAVDRVFPQAAKNGTYQISLTLDQAPEKVLGGMDAEAALTFANVNGRTLQIELAAVVGNPLGDPYVWVVKDSTVSKRIVTTGKIRAEGQIEILSGLTPGEQVATRGVNQLIEGQAVKISGTP